MKAKNILKVRERLDELSEETAFSESDSSVRMTCRFNPWDEWVEIVEHGDKYKELTLTLKEARRLKQLLNRLV